MVFSQGANAVTLLNIILQKSALRSAHLTRKPVKMALGRGLGLITVPRLLHQGLLPEVSIVQLLVVYVVCSLFVDYVVVYLAKT